MSRRLFLILLSLGVAGCDLLTDDCIQVPGRKLLPGTYALVGDGAPSGSPLSSFVPPEGAEDVTLTISEERTEVVLRYQLNGSSFEDRWSVVESKKYW